MDYSSRALKHFVGSLKLAWPGAYSHAPKQGYIGLRKDSAVEVTAGRRYPPRPLQNPEVLRCDRESPCCLADMKLHAVHYGSAYVQGWKPTI